MIANKKVSLQQVYDATQLLGFEESPKRGGIELAFRDGAALLPVAKKETLPQLAKLLRVLIRMHVHRGVEVTGAPTVFRPASDYINIVEVGVG